MDKETVKKIEQFYRDLGLDPKKQNEWPYKEIEYPFNMKFKKFVFGRLIDEDEESKYVLKTRHLS
jgi:hypothetical protein